MSDRVEASPAGVRVVNPFTTHELSWSEVEAFSSERYLVVHRSDGDVITAWAVQAANAARMAGRRSRADDVADRLRELAAAAGDRVVPVPPSADTRRAAIVYAAMWVVVASAVLVLLLGVRAGQLPVGRRSPVPEPRPYPNPARQAAPTHRPHLDLLASGRPDTRVAGHRARTRVSRLAEGW